MKTLIVVGVVLAIAGCARKGGTPPAGAQGAKRLPRVTVASVEKKPLAYTIETIGSVAAREEVRVAAGVEGVATEVSFKEGDRVTPDSVLCAVDVARYALEEESARAEHTRAQADANRALILYRQRIPLHEKKYITDEELADHKAAVDRADAETKRTEAALKIAGKTLRDAHVRPPIAGTINMKGVSTGEWVRAETVVATIVDLSELHVTFSVPESEAGTVTAGLTGEFRARAQGGKPLKAVLYWVSETADVKTRSVWCKARLEGDVAGLKPGLSGTVTLTLEMKSGAVVVPMEAVLPTERGFVVFVLEGGKAVEKRLKVGVHTDDEEVEVLEGLSGGETLVVRGGSALRAGQEVEVVK